MMLCVPIESVAGMAINDERLWVCLSRIYLLLLFCIVPVLYQLWKLCDLNITKGKSWQNLMKIMSAVCLLVM